MCTIALAFRSHKDYPLIFAGNRDEFYERPTAQASYWEEAPFLLAGRDLVHGGTWFGVTISGRFAAVTNYRDLSAHRDHALSKGVLTARYLLGDQDAASFLKDTNRSREEYNPFNLLVGDTRSLYYYSNLTGEITMLEPGTYGLSNHLLNTPWPKVARITGELDDYLSGADRPEPELLQRMLSNRNRFKNDLLPDTGVGPELESLLSSIFIASPAYGTRSSTVLIIDGGLKARFSEISYSSAEDGGSKINFDFTVEPDGRLS